MKRLFKLALLIVLLSAGSSCKKVGCWECTFDQVPGYNQKPPEKICNDNPENYQWIDDAGNPVNSHCKRTL